MSMVMVTVVITGFCQPDEVNLSLIHIRQTEVLLHANKYLCNCLQTKDGKATDSCFTLIYTTETSLSAHVNAANRFGVAM